jgi:hypothetical protein
MIRYTAKIILANAIRMLLEDNLQGCTVDSSDRSEAVVTLEVARDDVTIHGDKGAIKEQIEDSIGVRVVSVHILEARCEYCDSNAPHRCECVLSADTDDQEEAA